MDHHHGLDDDARPDRRARCDLTSSPPEDGAAGDDPARGDARRGIEIVAAKVKGLLRSAS